MDSMFSVPRLFVGRKSELENLEAHSQEITGSAGWIDVISGEPGIGKTSLIAENIRRLADSGGVAHIGRCIEGSAPMYWPWLEIIRSVAESVDLDRFASDANIRFDTFDSFAPGILPKAAVEKSANVPLFLEQQTPKLLLYQALLEFLTFAARNGSTILIIDDFQWADGASCDLMSYFAREIGRIPIHFVCAYRNTDVRRTSPIAKSLGTMLASPRSGFLHLGGFSFAEIRELLVNSERYQEGAGDLDEHAADLLVRTGGNALLVRALVDASEAEGVMGNRSLPENARHLIGLYLSELGADELDILNHAAILGAEYSISRLARIVDSRPVGEIIGTLDAAVRRGLLHPVSGESDMYRFRHDVVRETVIAELNLSLRVELHAKCAERLEEMRNAGEDIPAFELFHHYSRSEIVHGGDKSGHFAVLAARDAVENHDPETAIHLLEPRVETVASRNPALGSLMYAALAPAYIKVGGYTRCLDSQRKAFELAVGTGNAETIRSLIKAINLPKQLDEENQKLTLKAIDILINDSKASDNGLIRKLEANHALNRLRTPDGIDEEADQISAEAAEAAAADGELGFATRLLNVRANLFCQAKLHDRQLAEIKAVRELYADRKGEINRLINIAGEFDALSRLKRFDELSDLIARMEAVCERHTDIVDAQFFLISCASRYVCIADWPSFERVFNAIRPKSDVNWSVLIPGFLGLVELDRLDEARSLFAPMPEKGPLRFHFIAQVPIYLIHTGNRWMSELMARTELAEIGEILPKPYVIAAIFKAFAALFTGNVEELRSNARRIDPCVVGSGHEIAGFLYQAVDDRDKAHELYTAGLVRDEEYTTEDGWLMFRLATLHWNSDRALADSWFTKARDHALKHGLKLLSRRIGDFAATGDVLGIQSENGIEPGTLRSRRKRGSYSLTDRETEVLREIVNGKTNAEIGEMLFISTRTVSNHVASILRKIQCSNRTEAARFASDHGLI